MELTLRLCRIEIETEQWICGAHNAAVVITIATYAAATAAVIAAAAAITVHRATDDDAVVQHRYVNANCNTSATDARSGC